MVRREDSRWRGSHADIDDKIAVEVWELPASSRARAQPIVEISFKVKAYDRAAIAKRNKLLALLKDRGWLLEEDQLKTQQIIGTIRPRKRRRLRVGRRRAAAQPYSVPFFTTIMLRSVQGPMCFATLNSPLTVRNCPSCNAV